MKTQKLALSLIEIDQTISPRLRTLNSEIVEHYVEIFKQLPPITVFYIVGKYFLVDGFHRIEAARKLELTEIKAEVIDGTRKRAIEYAITSNTKHGQPLTTEDRHRAVLILKAIHPKWSLRQLAGAVGCDHKTVDYVLKAQEVKQSVESSTLTVRTTTTKGKPKKKPTLTDKHLAEIHEAPKDTWQELAQTVAAKGYSSEIVGDIVQELKDPEVSEERKQKLVSGKALPLTEDTDGEPAVRGEVMALKLSEIRDKNVSRAILNVLEAIDKAKEFPPTHVVKNLSEHELKALRDDLPSALFYLEELKQSLDIESNIVEGSQCH